MKQKNSILVLGALVGLVLIGSTFRSQGKLSSAPDVKLTAEQKEFTKLQSRFEQVKARYKTHVERREKLEETVRSLDEGNRELAKIGAEKTKILENRPVNKGQVLLSDEESNRIEELNQEEIKKQELLLANIQKLSELK